jgi:hypothetical protein
LKLNTQFTSQSVHLLLLLLRVAIAGSGVLLFDVPLLLVLCIATARDRCCCSNFDRLYLNSIRNGGCCATAAAARSTIGGTAIEFKSKWGLLRNRCCCSKFDRRHCN